MRKLPRVEYTKKQMLLLASKLSRAKPYESTRAEIGHKLRRYYTKDTGVSKRKCSRRGSYWGISWYSTASCRSLWYPGPEDFLRLRFPKIYRLMYRTSLEDVPLHLGDPKERYTPIVAEWRLEIGY